MAVTLGQGFAPYLLADIRAAIGDKACPEIKIENIGFTNFLMSQDRPEVLRINNGDQKRTVQIKYHQRLIPGMTSTADSCTVTNVIPYLESSVNLSVFRQIALFLDDAFIQNYTADCLKFKEEGQPRTKIQDEMLKVVAAGCNAIMESTNQDLIALLNFGTNRLTNSNAASPINFTQNTTNLPLNDGYTSVLSQFKQNLMYGTPEIVGNGFWLNYFMQQVAKGNAQNGLDTKIESMNSKFYFDFDSITSWGNNQALVAQKNAVQLVEFFNYDPASFRSGPRPGASQFGVITLPFFTTENEVKMVKFDFQLRYEDCPGNTYTDEYYGTPLTLSRGFNLIISKTSGLFQVPANAYRNADSMFGNNGTLRFTATNN